MRPVDPSVYVIVDPSATRGRDIVEVARAAVAGGATLIQLRDKASDMRLMVERARALVVAMLSTGVPVLVNDRIDVSLAVGAAGVHLGQSDMDPVVARRILGPNAIVGLTIRTEAEALETPLGPADYAAIGGVFPTRSKVNETPPLGLDGLARLAMILRVRKPALSLCAIAGMTAANAAEVVQAGVDGVAVISEVLAAGDPGAATARLAAAVRAGKEPS